MNELVPDNPKKKNQVVVGTAQYVNQQTGEVEDFTVITKNVSKDFNWHKVWLQDVLNILDSFGNKKIIVLTYLLKNMRNEDNSISGSYRTIAEKCNVSYPTVALVMKELIESNVIKKLDTATYIFNPDLISKGSSEKRTKLLIKYNFPDDEVNAIENARDADVELEPDPSFGKEDGEGDVMQISEPTIMDAIEREEKENAQ